MKKQKENSREGITWSEMGKQNVQAEKVYYLQTTRTVFFFLHIPPTLHMRIFVCVLHRKRNGHQARKFASASCEATNEREAGV